MLNGHDLTLGQFNSMSKRHQPLSVQSIISCSRLRAKEIFLNHDSEWAWISGSALETKRGLRDEIMVQWAVWGSLGWGLFCWILQNVISSCAVPVLLVPARCSISVRAAYLCRSDCRWSPALSLVFQSRPAAAYWKFPCRGTPSDTTLGGGRKTCCLSGHLGGA